MYLYVKKSIFNRYEYFETILLDIIVSVVDKYVSFIVYNPLIKNAAMLVMVVFDFFTIKLVLSDATKPDIDKTIL